MKITKGDELIATLVGGRWTFYDKEFRSLKERLDRDGIEAIGGEPKDVREDGALTTYDGTKVFKPGDPDFAFMFWAEVRNAGYEVEAPFEIVNEDGDVVAEIGDSDEWQYSDEGFETQVDILLIEGIPVGRKNYLPGDAKFEELFWQQLDESGYAVVQKEVAYA